MKKILFLTRYYKPHIGGVETHVEQVTNILRKKGHDVTVVTSHGDGTGVITIPFDSEASKLKTWAWITDHVQLFKEADIVHVHDVFWWVFPLLPVVRHKLFITFHGWEGQFPIKKTSILQRIVAAKSAKGNIQVGEYIQKWYLTKPSIVTYGGVDTAQIAEKKSGPSILKKVFDAARSGKFLYGQGSKYSAIFLGRLSKDNDVDKVVELFRLWKEKDNKAKFLFVGDGELRSECEKVGEVTGFVQQPEQFFSQTNVVCASSYLSIMSAHINKKLVLSFYSNPLKKDYLLGYPQVSHMIVENEATVAKQKLDDLLRDKNKYNLYIESAYAWVKTQTWEKVVEQYEQLWMLTLK